MKLTVVILLGVFGVLSWGLVSGIGAEPSSDIVVIGATPPPVSRPLLTQPLSEKPESAAVQILDMPDRAPSVAHGQAPIGSIMAWAKSMPKTPDLPGGWVECNGQEIKDPSSPYRGKMVPNLNGLGDEPVRFLRGATSSGAAGGAADHMHGASRAQKYGDSRKPVGGYGRVSHLPPYYDVVWIIRVK